jgi:HSP20 family molecular chaperone IbpA
MNSIFTAALPKIVLPVNADPVFISAEYKAGILLLYIPKSTRPSKWMNTKIAIY